MQAFSASFLRNPIECCACGSAGESLNRMPEPQKKSAETAALSFAKLVSLFVHAAMTAVCAFVVRVQITAFIFLLAIGPQFVRPALAAFSVGVSDVALFARVVRSAFYGLLLCCIPQCDYAQQGECNN